MLVFKNNIYEPYNLSKPNIIGTPDANYNQLFNPRQFIEVALKEDKEILHNASVIKIRFITLLYLYLGDLPLNLFWLMAFWLLNVSFLNDLLLLPDRDVERRTSKSLEELVDTMVALYVAPPW